jgi:hypothetical protein
VNLELTDAEAQFLQEVLEEKQDRMIQEIDHTDTNRFEELLRRKLEVLEGLKRKIDSSKP